MFINLASYVPVSTVDDLGYASSVIFFRGCDMPCWFCHNHKYKYGSTPQDIINIEELLQRDSMLTSSITLSGGEPLLQSDCVEHIAKCVHLIGKQVCLYTSGNHPDELKKVIEHIDRIYIDFKSESIGSENYDLYLRRFIRTLSICDDYNVDVTVTTVVFDITDDTLDEIEDIRYFIGDKKFMVIQGLLETGNHLKPDEMKRQYKNCYIRTIENGVEWND